MKNISNKILLAFALLAFPAGCSDVVEAYDCNAICSRYSECFDKDYDVSACTSNCRDKADESQDYADKASACESCIDDKSCSGAFGCASECLGIVP